MAHASGRVEEPALRKFDNAVRRIAPRKVVISAVVLPDSWQGTKQPVVQVGQLRMQVHVN